MGLAYLQIFSRKRGKRFCRISDAAAEVLLSYRWPGNVRELRNAMEWVSFMFDDEELRVEHFGRLLNKAAPADGEARNLAEARPVARKRLERAVQDDHMTDAVEQALERFHGNKTQAARFLGISIRTLYYRLERARKEPAKAQEG